VLELLNVKNIGFSFALKIAIIYEAAAVNGAGRRCGAFALLDQTGGIGLKGSMSKRNPNPIDVHVGNRVRMRRMLIGMSQEKLGERLGLTFQQVQKYEKGSNRVSASRLHHMAQILGVPVQYFFDDLPAGAAEGRVEGFAESSEPGMIMSFLSSSEGLQLTRAFNEIGDAEVRRRVIDLVKSLANRPHQPA
jgi:transcriptional regulator with XRE-family HTH domain